MGKESSLKERPRVGLALAGGFARGIAHIGVLRALKQGGIPIDVVAGTSVGALIGACYCAGAELNDMQRIGALTNFTDFGRWTPVLAWIGYQSAHRALSGPVYRKKNIRGIDHASGHRRDRYQRGRYRLLLWGTAGSAATRLVRVSRLICAHTLRRSNLGRRISHRPGSRGRRCITGGGCGHRGVLGTRSRGLPANRRRCDQPVLHDYPAPHRPGLAATSGCDHRAGRKTISVGRLHADSPIGGSWSSRRHRRAAKDSRASGSCESRTGSLSPLPGPSRLAKPQLAPALLPPCPAG
jgi:hypothetical protein